MSNKKNQDYIAETLLWIVVAAIMMALLFNSGCSSAHNHNSKRYQQAKSR